MNKYSRANHVYLLVILLSFLNISSILAENRTSSLRKKTVPCAPEPDGDMENPSPDLFTMKAENLRSIVGETKFCENNTAGGYACEGVDLESFLSLGDLGGPLGLLGAGGGANDIWGWTSPETGIEYALVGLRSGTAFVDLSTPTNPILLGRLKAHAMNSNWLDIKTYDNHAFVVSESPLQGMQIFDLTQLDSLSRTKPDMNLPETAHHAGVGSAHNIVINEESGFAYIVGSKFCVFGLYMVDISTPTDPQFVGCFRKDGYVHDAQCVNYDGPDTDFDSREICFCCNEDTVTIVDVTDKRNPSLISKLKYNKGITYTHQGWLTEDKRFFILDDELDAGPTQTYVIDVSSLSNPSLRSRFCQNFASPDHNQYVKGNFTYQSNYRAGFRILDIEQVYEPDGELEEVAFFDIFKMNNANGFNGAWSNYPWFESGNVIISGIEQGLFIVRPHISYNSSVFVSDIELDLIQNNSTKNKDKVVESVSITIKVNDNSDLAVQGANVTGSFYNGLKKNSCKTNQEGKCTILSDNLPGGINDMVFNIDYVMKRLHRYDKKENKVSSLKLTKSKHGFRTIKSKHIPKESKKTKFPIWALPKILKKITNEDRSQY